MPQNQITDLSNDPETLARVLEMELALKRTQWQRTRAQRGTWRALSILFLLLVIGGALAAYFYFAPEIVRHAESTSQTEAVDSTR